MAGSCYDALTITAKPLECQVLLEHLKEEDAQDAADCEQHDAAHQFLHPRGSGITDIFGAVVIGTKTERNGDAEELETIDCEHGVLTSLFNRCLYYATFERKEQ